MQNFNEKGARMLHTALSPITSGAPVVVGSRIGVACGDIPTGETGVLAMEGVYSLPKATGAINQGVDCYFDADGTPVGGASNAGAITTTADSNTAAGYAFEAAGSTDTHVAVKLRG